MPAKTPIYLKTGNSKKGKKFRLRDVLSSDLISPPLGDFRHTIHIGQDGQHDFFGDISFLQGNLELLPGSQEKAKKGYLKGHNEFLRANSTCDSVYSESSSPVLKNAISLPTIGGSQPLALPLLSSVTFNSKRDSYNSYKSSILNCEPVLEEKCQRYENEDEFDSGSTWKLNGSACSTNGRSSHSSSLSDQYSEWQGLDLFEENPISSNMENTALKPDESLSDLAGSLLTLQLDLGPSLLDEVLHVMDKNKA